MNHSEHDTQTGAHPAGPRLNRGWIAFAIFMAVALFFLLTEHRAHFFGALPYLLILACPLLHFFHHGGHGGHGGHAHGSDKPADRETRTTKET